jgi:thiamine biosynthesis lipoprotein
VNAAAALDTLPVGPGTAQWSVWSTTARLVVTEPGALAAARELVEQQLAAVDLVCSRFRPDFELALLAPDRAATVSPLLAELVGAALAAAGRTDGDVDPTMGEPLARLGYDRDIAQVLGSAAGAPVTIRPAPGWRRVRLHRRQLTVPAGVVLDLGATAKACTADRCAELVAATLGTGVLVSLGGDIATAGAAPAGGWRVLVADQPADPHCTLALPAGAAIATSSTCSRTWRRGDRLLHHVLDPRTCQPVKPVWRSASVVADRCVDAHTISTAALVRGGRAPAWLGRLGVPARLVGEQGTVLTLGGWPEERS